MSLMRSYHSSKHRVTRTVFPLREKAIKAVTRREGLTYKDRRLWYKNEK